MKVTIIGTGYVGLVTGALFADRGHTVTCVDINEEIVKNLNDGKSHIYEPGLDGIIQRGVEKKLLFFTTNTESAVVNADIIFLAVGTPSSEKGDFDLSYLRLAAKTVGMAMNDSTGFKVVVGKSTVPQGTYKVIESIITAEVSENKNLEWAYVANPETLAEGSAVRDFSTPDRIIIGTRSEKAFLLMKELYHPFNVTSDRIIRGSPADAELAKLFSNTTLAARIAMVNEFSRIADTTKNADMDIIRRMVCEDKRIGYKFMFPSPGYGGSCFPKDVRGLVAESEEKGYTPLFLSRIDESNELHKQYVAHKVLHYLTMEKPVVGIWGVTFKPKTDDMRESSAITVINALLDAGVRVKVFDPQPGKAKELFGDKVEFVSAQYEAAEAVDALLLLTEWSCFDAPDFLTLKEVMKGNMLFDLRNRWIPEIVSNYGFTYVGIGRSKLLDEKNIPI